MLKNINQKKIFIIVLFIISILSCKSNQINEETIYQISTIDALLEGIYDGDTTTGQLKNYGNIGIGTYNNLDGEMVFLDGCFYRIKGDGKVEVVNDDNKTPFAAVTFFNPDKNILIKDKVDFKSLTDYLDKNIPSKNIFYTIKIDGLFKYVKTRSVPKQNKPYIKLTEIVKNQPVYEFNDIKGTIVGFRLPVYVKGLNVSGYHMHFITDDKKAGGHVLELKAENIKVEMDFSSKFFVTVLDNKEFYNMDFTGDKEKDIQKVEK